MNAVPQTGPTRVPQPPVKPLVGNLGDIDSKAPVQSMMRLAAEYGPIFRLNLAGRSFYVVSSQVLVDELCDESRFVKRLHAPLLEIRAFAGDGLFTAHNSEPNWGKAHRLLMPAFGPLGVRAMFDRMVDVAHQMFEKWERFGPTAPIDVADNMTRLTLDTIALCAFDYRFNSFYQNEMHPFVAAMVDALDEAGQRTRRLDIVTQLKLGAKRRYESSQALLAKVAEALIAERRSDPDGAGKSDLLNVMLNGVDPVTGEKLSDENIRFQMVTFLIAGHETTSGLLSFACYLLLKNPDVLVRAQALCDEVLGDEMPRLEHLSRLRFVEQILMETLRLWPTAPAFAVKPVEATTLAGRYALTPDDTLLILEPALHRDPAVWGDDAEAFRPERFEPAVAEKLPPNAWKPFGNGARACIGRSFAMQEAQLVLAMLLQRFDIVLADPAYQLVVAETLTLKPHGLEIRARRRGTGRFALANAMPAPAQRLRGEPADAVALASDAPRLAVLYGSNTGSCEMFARRIAADAARHGYAATVATMDEHAAVPAAGTALVVVTASYEGQPPDNAKRFVSWLEACAGDALAGTPVAVFGCGNRQWARTYQQVPKRVDAALASAGAVPVRPRGEADAGGDFFGAFDEWYAGLWHDLDVALGRAHPAAAALAAAPAFEVEVVRAGRETALQLNELETGSVIERRELVDMARPGARSKLHLQIALPEGMRYRAGDYLAVLPRNPEATVTRALRRFGLAADTQIVIRKPAGSASTSLPAGYPVGAAELLAGYVELSQPATRAQLGQLAAATPCPPERDRLAQLAEEPAYSAEVLGGRLAVLDLLEQAHSCSLPFAAFLAMLPPMRARQYSISSSPLAGETEASLTVAVVDGPVWSTGRPALSGHGRFSGVASSYLARLAPGDRFSMAVRPSQSGFRPPADPATPMVMVCAGTGVAPFRGFLQERAAQKAAGRDVGPALLFFGVDHPEVDSLYRDEFAAWAEAGVVDVRMAFSALPRDGIGFVQDRVWHDRDDIRALFLAGAQFYVCGDGKHMAPAVRETFLRIYKSATQADDATADAWANRMEHEHGRYVSDVFA